MPVVLRVGLLHCVAVVLRIGGSYYLVLVIPVFGAV